MSLLSSGEQSLVYEKLRDILLYRDVLPAAISSSKWDTLNNFVPEL